MNYINIIVVSLLLFSCYINCSYSNDIYLGKKYRIIVDKKVFGNIDVTFKSGCENITKQYRCICSYKVTFFQHSLVNNSDAVYNINQDLHLNIIKYQKEQSFLTDNLTYKNILPLEWDFFNCFQSTQTDSEVFDDLIIYMSFHSSPVQKVIILKIAELSFNFYLSNSRINFLIFSNTRNANFTSMNQLKYNDQEAYENISLISKVTILNIASVNNNNRDKYLNNNKCETSNNEFYNGNTISRSSKVISMSEDKKEIINKKQAKKKITLYKNKTMNSIPSSRLDKNILSILNNYCNTKIDQDYFFLLSGDFISFLKTSLENIDSVNKKNNAVMLVNPFTPSFVFNSDQMPQIKMFNIYILYLYIEALDDKKGFIFHFYSKENFLNIDLCAIKAKYDSDFLTIYIDESNYIRNITINEDSHRIEYVLDDDHLI
jgi:hypothetical protein